MKSPRAVHHNPKVYKDKTKWRKDNGLEISKEFFASSRR